MDRRSFVLSAIGLSGTGLLAACSDDVDPTSGSAATTPSSAPMTRGSFVPPPGAPGLVNEARWQARVDEYLATVTQQSDLSRFGDVAAQLVRAHRDPDYVWDVDGVTAEGFAWAWEYFDELGTPRDFRVLDLLWLLHLSDGTTPMRTLDRAVAAMGLDLCLLDIAAHTHRGTYTAARGRTYKKDKCAATDEPTFTMATLLFDDTEVGYDFDDPANLGFWWSLNALGLWQVVDLSLAEGERHRIFEAEEREPIRLLFEAHDWDPQRVKVFLRENRPVLDGSFGEADTYHWRNDVVALASVVDHRFGHMRPQTHAWQATIDETALVFTTHPMTEPAQSDRWNDDPKPGYWTGEASMPRSAQHERTAIHVYQPAWGAGTIDPVLAALFTYRDYTHAWFPQDAFDEVVRDGSWTFGRKGDGYVALHSWRPTEWREYDPTVHATRGMELPFDLVAAGGPDNVWVVEVGDAGQGGFSSWLDERIGAPVSIERDDVGFRVEWRSPATGTLSFGSTGPFQVDGEEQPLADFPRHASPWGTVERLEQRYELTAGDASLTLDFDAMTRALT